jgi:hypothetical protein
MGRRQAMDAVTLLRLQMDEAWKTVSRAMDDVDDAMLRWTPAAGGCWELRLHAGRWRPDYHGEQPLPPGPKTIGWLAAHLATCKEMYFEYAFGPGKKSWDELTVPGDAEGMRLYLARTQAPLRRALDGLGARDLDASTLTNWGETKPVWWILSTMVLHDLEHGGQIWQVRNQYAISHMPA